MSDKEPEPELESGLELDPKGYFLIRIIPEDHKVAVGFCHYTPEQLRGQFSKNKVEEEIVSDDYEELIKWSAERISREDHLEYMRRELKKALSALDKGEEYHQD